MELTREQLYQMLWTDGVGKTQEALGLRPEEMKKLCEEFQIPKPTTKYWVALACDKAPEKTPLPEVEDNRPIKTEDYVKPRRVKKEKVERTPVVKTPDGKYPPRELPEEPATIYSVPEKLLAMDPILLDTKQMLRERNRRRDNPWSKKNPYKSSPNKWLSISVDEPQEDRAIRIFETIWKAAEAQGYHLKIEVDKGAYHTTCTSYFQVRQYQIRVELREINKRVKEEGGGIWASSTLVGSGRLKFICDREEHRSYYNDERIAAQDTEHTRLEDKIERIIQVLGEIADARDQAEIERKQAEERRKKEEELRLIEEEKMRQEAERQAKIEARRQEERDLVSDLLFNTERLKVAMLIRDYADRFEAAMKGKMDADELQEKLAWMRGKADFMDPFIAREDEWLGPKDIGKLLSPEITRITEEARSGWNSYGHETTKSFWQIKNSGWWNR